MIAHLKTNYRQTNVNSILRDDIEKIENVIR